MTGRDSEPSVAAKNGSVAMDPDFAVAPDKFGKVIPESDLELFAAFSAYQRVRAFSESTIRRRKTSIEGFARHMAPVSITAASPDDVLEWLGLRAAARTRHAYRSDLASFFKWAHRRGLVEDNPLLLVDTIKVPKALPKPAPAEAIAAAYVTADRDTQLMLLLGSLAGLRCAEIASLQRSDFHLSAEPPVVHVRNGKGAKDRIVPLHPTLVAQVQLGSAWIFRKVARPLTAEQVGDRLRRALSRGDKRVTAHQLRHYFGTEAARWSNGNVVLVGQLMGHASTNTTMGYIGWNPVEGHEVVSKIVAAGVDDDLAARRRLRSA